MAGWVALAPYWDVDSLVCPYRLFLCAPQRLKLEWFILSVLVLPHYRSHYR